MKLPKLFQTLLLVAMVATMSSCRIVWTDPPTPTPIPTATATSTLTPTPTDTPTPTITPVPTQSINAIANALMPAAQGMEVAEAAVYDPYKAGSHPIVFIAANDQKWWNNQLPSSWQPSNISQVELLAVLRFINIQIDSRRYRMPGGGLVYVRSYRVDTEVMLREARTGNLIATTLFRGETAPTLKHQLPAGTQALYGDIVAYETVELWLKDYVEK